MSDPMRPRAAMGHGSNPYPDAETTAKQTITAKLTRMQNPTPSNKADASGGTKQAPSPLTGRQRLAKLAGQE